MIHVLLGVLVKTGSSAIIDNAQQNATVSVSVSGTVYGTDNGTSNALQTGTITSIVQLLTLDEFQVHYTETLFVEKEKKENK